MIRYNIILTLFSLLFLFTNCTYGQSVTEYSYEVFSNISLNNQLSIINLSNSNLESEHISIYIGDPIDEDCIDHAAYSECKLSYDGLTLQYTNRFGSFDFDSAILNDSNPFISYQGTNIHVGDNIDLLEETFLEAYNNRGSSTDGDHSIRLRLSNTSILIEFKYDVTSKLINKIKVRQSNV